MLFSKKSHTFGEDTKNWYKDKYESVRQQRDVLTFISVVCLFASVAAVFTVMWLTPYKSVEPFVIEIEERTGIVQRVDPVTRSEFTASEVIDRFFIAQYVRARESYIPDIIRTNREMVRVMSDRFNFREYLRATSEANAASPAYILRDGGQRRVDFKTISFIERKGEEKQSGRKVAQARIIITDIGRKMSAPIEYHTVVTITYQYSSLSLNESERYLNPLGFLVVGYQMEREVI